MNERELMQLAEDAADRGDFETALDYIAKANIASMDKFPLGQYPND